jgi:hypothetical protein
MSGSTPGRNPISSLSEVTGIAKSTGKFYLIKWRLPENSQVYILQPVDFAPLGPYIIDKIYGEGVDTFIRADQLSCDMRILDFFKKFGGLFESTEHIQEYELRIKWLKSHEQEYLEKLDKMDSRRRKNTR